MKIRFADLQIAMAKIEKTSDKGFVDINFNQYTSSLILSFKTPDDTIVEINLFDEKVDKMATIKEEKWLSK